MVSLAIKGPNIYPQGDFLTTRSLRQDRQDSSGHGAGCGGNQSGGGVGFGAGGDHGGYGGGGEQYGAQACVHFDRLLRRDRAGGSSELHMPSSEVIKASEVLRDSEVIKGSVDSLHSPLHP